MDYPPKGRVEQLVKICILWNIFGWIPNTLFFKIFEWLNLFPLWKCTR